MTRPTVPGGRMARARRPRRGFSLVEIIVAVTLLAVVSVSLAGLTVQMARGAEGERVASHRNAKVLTEASRLEVVPFDSLPGEAGTRKMTGGVFPHTNTVHVAWNNDSARVTVVVAPAAPKVRPETLSFLRVRVRAGNPFGVP